jgi:hypothetical protein
MWESKDARGRGRSDGGVVTVQKVEDGEREMADFIEAKGSQSYRKCQTVAHVSTSAY